MPRAVRFADVAMARPKCAGLDAVTKLAHFAIVTYLVEPAALRAHIPERFELVTVPTRSGQRGLISVVPFEDRDFTSAVFPAPRFRFGQTNYRAYVRDVETDTPAVWFFGTVLDSWTVAIPRHLWRLPWHHGRMEFDCELESGLYGRYRVETSSRWASARLELAQTGDEQFTHVGFPDAATAFAVLTHPLKGVYRRRDNELGSYDVWHDRLEVKPAACLSARFDLLDRLGLVSFERQARPYSVLVQPETEFTIYLPPRRLGPTAENG
ncbi:MAG: DUF2071 domain-containing protein [Acidobacteria bacterium]|nr:DUF2071 domain-containing protein [Acidobacteriota bacterium]